MLNHPRILVCTDFSPHADRALKVAARLAKKSGGTVRLLHVAGADPWYTTTGEAVLGEWAPLARTALMDLAMAQVKRCGVEAKIEVAVGEDPARGIRKRIVEGRPELVVLGCKGAGEIAGSGIGSITRKTLATSPSPVLVVRTEAPPTRVAALLDGEEDMAPCLDWADDLGNLEGAAREAISLVPDFDFYVGSLEYSAPLAQSIAETVERRVGILRDEIRAKLGSRQAQITVTRAGTSGVAASLVDLLHGHGVGLAVVRGHHKKWAERFLLGSVSNRVLELFNGNVLVC